MNHIKLSQSPELKVDGDCEATQVNIMLALLLFFVGHPLIANAGDSLGG